MPSDSPKQLGKKILPKAAPDRVCYGLLWMAMAAYVIVFLRITFRQLDHLGTRSYDLGIFDQATWLISRGHTPFVTVRGMHLLGEHFSAILYLLAPLYWIWDSPKALLAAQTMALSLGALPIYALARRQTRSAPVALTFSLAYLLYPALQWSNVFEFHPDVFATPCLLAAFYFLLCARWRPYFLFLTLAALTKETIGPIIIALGLYALSRDRRIGGLTIVLGGLALLVSLKTVSYFNQGTPSIFYLLYVKYGSSPLTIAGYGLTHPLQIAVDLNTPENRHYLVQLLMPVMFLSLLAPDVLLIALPVMLLNLLSNRTLTHTIYFQYTAPITPFIFLSAIFGFERCRRWGNPLTYRLLLLCLPLGTIAVAAQRPHIASALVPMAQAQETREIISRIPPNASISTQPALIPYLGHRQAIYVFPNPFQKAVWGGSAESLPQMGGVGYALPTPTRLRQVIDAADVQYVALCAPVSAFPVHTDMYFQFATPLLQSPTYGIVALGEDTLLLRRGADHAYGLRLLAQRSGMAIRSEADVSRAFLVWAADQPKNASKLPIH